MQNKNHIYFPKHFVPVHSRTCAARLRVGRRLADGDGVDSDCDGEDPEDPDAAEDGSKADGCGCSATPGSLGGLGLPLLLLALVARRRRPVPCLRG